MNSRVVKAAIAASGLLLLAGGGLAGIGWYYADALRDDALAPHREPDKLDLEVVALGEGKVTLRRTELTHEDGDWRREGVFGLEWSGGYAQAGRIISADVDEVVRQFVPILGEITVGERVRLDSFAFPADPRAAHGIAFQDVSYRSPLGDFPAWFVPGEGDMWAVFVHGKGASRREALRMLPVVTGLGFPSLVITYRNDEETAPDPSGYYRYGETEWQDLEAAVRYALNEGAERVVLVGYSMGGGIVASFIYRSPLAEHVAAVVLDSPMLDFGAAVEWGARDRDVPGFVTGIGKAIAGLRFDIHWAGLNYLDRAGRLVAPVLLIHGDDDDRVPVETSDRLAALRPDIVTYYRLPGAGHVRSWNLNPAEYESTVRGFLSKIVPSPGARERRLGPS